MRSLVWITFAAAALLGCATARSPSAKQVVITTGIVDDHCGSMGHCMLLHIRNNSAQRLTIPVSESAKRWFAVEPLYQFEKLELEGTPVWKPTAQSIGTFLAAPNNASLGPGDTFDLWVPFPSLGPINSKNVFRIVLLDVHSVAFLSSAFDAAGRAADKSTPER